MVTIRPQGRSSLPNLKEIYCLLGKTVTMLKASHLSPGKLMSLGKHGFNGEDYTIGLSAHEVIPMVSGNTADIFSLWISHFLGLWFKDQLHWWTNNSILKEDSPLLQEHSFLSIHRSFPNGLGCFLESSTAIGLWNQEESRLLIT